MSETTKQIDTVKLSQDFKTTDSIGRYAAYSRLILRMSRYLAFTSDLGEAFRPVVSQSVVRASYGISWIYVIGDVCYEGKKEKDRGSDQGKVKLVMAERLTFQVIASMMIPAFLIHSQVHLFQKITKKINRFQKWGPTIAGLAVIPFLPVFLDQPCEHAVQSLFHQYLHDPNNKHSS